MQLEKFPEHAEAGRAKFPRYADTMDDLFARRRRTLMAAHDAGVAPYAGSYSGPVSRHGNLSGEVLAIIYLCFTAQEALSAASYRASSCLASSPPPPSRCAASSSLLPHHSSPDISS